MIGMTWTGWDGSVWDLRTGPVRLAAGGLEGILGMIEGEDVVRTAAELDGQEFLGWRASPRTGLMPVLIGPFASEADYLKTDHAWWRTMRLGKTGTLEVQTYDGKTRRIGLRFQNDGLSGLPNWGNLRGRTYVAPIRVIADDPWWYGDPIGATYTSGQGFNFFGAGKKGPPFKIAKSNTVAKATFTNPGDEETWPKYTIEGPIINWQVKFGGGLVNGGGLLVGQKLVVDTSPLKKIARQYDPDGSVYRVTNELGAIDFRPIPAASKVDLELTLFGPGRFRISAETRYQKAWG